MNPSAMDDFFRNIGTAFAQLADTLGDIEALHGVATARGYDQWQDSDLAGVGLTRNELLAILYFMDDLYNFIHNGTPAQQDRMPTVQKYRGDL